MQTVNPPSFLEGVCRQYGTVLMLGFLLCLAVAGKALPANPPLKLVFSTQPTGTTINTNIAPAVIVRLVNRQGHTVPVNAVVSLAIGQNPGGGKLSGKTTIAMIKGVATFSNLSIDTAGTGYTLSVMQKCQYFSTAKNVQSALSQPFNITGLPAKMTFGIHPCDTPAGTTIDSAVTVRILDADGRLVPNAGNAVTLAMGANPGSGTLAGTLTHNAVNGVATFSDLCIDKTGTGYTLCASASGLTSTTSHTFNITSGSATKLVFNGQPSNTIAGATITPAVTVSVMDAGNNLVNTANAAITLALDANPGGGTLSGTKTVNAVNGVATFSGLSINKPGTGYTLNATASGLASATSTTFNITVGSAAKVVFSQQPTVTTAGSAITPAVTVTVEDAQNNIITTATTAITLAISTNPAGGTLSGTKTVNAVNGVATFANLSINKAGTGYTLNATATGLTSATSSSFNIIAGSATQLVFGTQPGNSTAGSAITPAVTVSIRDAQGNIVTTATTAITVAIGTNPGSSTLSGTKTVNAVNGVATFNNLALNRPGTGYSLTTVATGLTGATSTAFNINVGAASQLAFGTQPANSTPGGVIAPAVTVQVLDYQGNLLPAASNAITLALDTNPGGTLSGTKTVNAVNGVATFSDLSIDNAGTGYTLNATATGLTSAVSNAFDITAQLSGILSRYHQRLQGVQIQPVTDIAESIVTYQMVHPDMVIIYPWPYQLGFSDEFVGRSGSLVNWDYYHANPGVDPQTPDIMIYAVRSWEEDGTEAADLLPKFHQLGWKVLLIASSAGMPQGLSYDYFLDNGASSGSKDETDVNMIANITLCWLWQCEYVAACTRMMGAHPGIYQSIEIPGADVYDAILRETPTAMYPTDAVIPAGEMAQAYLSRVEWLIGQLAGSTFQGHLNNAADIVSARMASGQQVGITAWNHCMPFEIFHAMKSPWKAFDIWSYTTDFKTNLNPGELVFFIGYSGMNIPPNCGDYIQAAGLDAIVSFRPTDDPDNFLPNILERLDQSWALGDAEVAIPFDPYSMAPFSTINGLLAIRMLDEAVASHTAPQLAFGTQPTNGTPGIAITPAVTVQVLDSQGNLLTTASNAITLALDTNPGSGTLSGTKTVNAVNGVATFNDLSIDVIGNGYTLVATAAGMTSATSTPFDMMVGPAAKLVFSQQPATTTAGSVITPAVTVTVQDAQNNTLTSATTAITLAIGSNPAGGTLSGTKTVNAVNGVATFSNLSIDKAGTGLTLTASTTGLTAATSTAFNITAGAASQLAFGVQPTNSTPGGVIAPAVTVQVLDSQGNPVSTATNAITLALNTNPGGTLSGTKTVNAVNGVATFSDLSIDTAGTGYTLEATAAGLTSATSNAFDIIAQQSGILYRYHQRLEQLQIQPVTDIAESIVAYQMIHPQMIIHYPWFYQPAFSDEFIGRSASLINWDWFHETPGVDPQTPDLMIYAVRSWEEDGAEAALVLPQFHQLGWKTILIASSAGMPAGLPYDYFLDNGASSGSKDETDVNMIANITLGRYWQCEYVAACTRMMGAHPGIEMSVGLPGGAEYDAYLAEDPTRMYPTDAVITAGSLSQAFKDRLEWLIGQLGGPTLQGHILNAADIVSSRMASGQRVGISGINHCVSGEVYHALKSPFIPFAGYTPSTFKNILSPGELAVFFGYTGMTVPLDYQGGFKDGGIDLIASFSPDTNPANNAPLALEHIDQSWDLGDAEIPIPFEPGKIATMSAINGLLIMRMLDEAVAVRLANANAGNQPGVTTSVTNLKDCMGDSGIDLLSNPGKVQLSPVDYKLDDVGNHIGPPCADPTYIAKKTFTLDTPGASGAKIYIFRSATQAFFNGTPLTFAPVPGSRGWLVADVPASALQQGTNEFVMLSGCAVPIDTDNNVGHSFYSTDGGSSWQAAPGEFLAHLRLNRYPSQGIATSQVIDFANLYGQDIICPRIDVTDMTATMTATRPAGTGIQLEVRTGNTIRPDNSWTPWGPSTGITPARFVQWRATLTTTDHSVTPVLESVRIDAAMTKTPVDKLTITSIGNQRITRSSLPYTYQPPSAKLSYLRTHWNLDAIVAPGTTELNRFILLQQWVRKQWPNNEGSCTRPWDAVDILNAPAGDHGMCTHFATVFTQCALALGYTARQTLLEHHCVSEIWSNDYQKWILVDEETTLGPDGVDIFNNYGTAMYWHEYTPLNAREIHDFWKNNDTKDITQTLYTTDTNGNYQSSSNVYDQATSYDLCFPVFGIPKRNNYLDQQEPWEEAQGNDYYHSNDYYWSSDGPIPDYEEFSSFTTRKGDLYWTLNQAALTITATDNPGQVTISIDTVTPNLQYFLCQVNNGAWQTVTAIPGENGSQQVTLAWPLAVGTNNFSVTPVNAFGNYGLFSSATIVRAQ